MKNLETKETTFRVEQNKKFFDMQGLLASNGKVKLFFDTCGDSRLSWQTPQENSKGWFINLYGKRVFLVNYVDLSI